MIAVIGCNTCQFDRFMEGKYNLKPQSNKRYFHVHRRKNLNGRHFEGYLDLDILPVPWELFEEVLTRILPK